MIVRRQRRRISEEKTNKSPGLDLSVSPGCSGNKNVWALGDNADVQLRDEYKDRDYTILKILGEGSFAQCLKICESHTGDVRAAKILPKKKLSARQSERFRRLNTETKASILNVRNEIEIHEDLSHPGIVKFESWFSDQNTGRLVLVLEYCKHGTLRQVMNKLEPSPIPTSMTIRWIGQLLAALTYIHEAPILVAHRDLNPDNLLVDAGLNLRMCDFGYAERLTSHGTTSGESIQNSVGTVNYIAPEVVLNNGSARKCDLRAADVWSVGVIMHELLVGRVPFELSQMPSTNDPAGSDLRCAPFLPLLEARSASLLAATLSRNPLSRPTARALGNHPFFQGSEPRADTRPGNSIDTVDLHVSSNALSLSPKHTSNTQHSLALVNDLAEDRFMLEARSPRLDEMTEAVPALLGMTNEHSALDLIPSNDTVTTTIAADIPLLECSDKSLSNSMRLNPGLELNSSFYWAHTLAGGDPHGDRRWIAAARAWVLGRQAQRQRWSWSNGSDGTSSGGSMSEDELSSDGESSADGRAPHYTLRRTSDDESVDYCGGSTLCFDGITALTAPTALPLSSSSPLANASSGLPAASK